MDYGMIGKIDKAKRYAEQRAGRAHADHALQVRRSLAPFRRTFDDVAA